METKTCLECGAKFNSAAEIIYHECDLDKIKDS